ncbi:hypothetical protein Ddye_000327 [Dipteronia dyeriana]|uniref:RNase H type-1 domain-containing protein n=1 Tax=Dipteronia dyeriana TaxID=168575 RepID=A0AAE0CSZ7_9ROSI|nr:hypothetical protein Ddye_000327 [Dipteronia dyeriana]
MVKMQCFFVKCIRATDDSQFLDFMLFSDMDVSSWEPPTVGLVKVNTDAAIDVIRKRIGIGIIIRDSNRVVMASRSRIIFVGYSLQIAEAVAVLRGIQFALDTGFRCCTIESDAQVIVNLINSKSCILSDVGLIIDDILCLRDKFMEWNVRFVPRRANMLTHFLLSWIYLPTLMVFGWRRFHQVWPQLFWVIARFLCSSVSVDLFP